MDAVTTVSLDRFHNRRVSCIEYYHACVGRSRQTLDVPREIVCVLRGYGAPFDLPRWQAALNAASAVNPGVRLLMRGAMLRSRWSSAGPQPRVRHVVGHRWNGLSDTGSQFIHDVCLDVRSGPVLELILAEGEENLVVLRVLHAVMDGQGAMFFLQELFRALRGERLIGTNTVVSDEEVMLRQRRSLNGKLPGQPLPVTGGPIGTERGDCWRRLVVNGPVDAVLARVILGVARRALRGGEPVRIALPVSLRRHIAEITTTMNLTSMIHIEVGGADSVVSVREKINAALLEGRELCLPTAIRAIKLLPLRVLDRLVSRTEKNYMRQPLLETAVVSNVGRFSSADFCCDLFTAEELFVLPAAGNTMAVICSLDDRISVSIGTKNIFASGGRLDELVTGVAAAMTGKRAALV